MCKTEIHRICKSNNVCSLFHTDNNFISGFIKWQEGFGECSHLTEESHITNEPQVCERVFPMLENVNENVDFNSCYYTKMTNFCGIQMLHEISNPEKTPWVLLINDQIQYCREYPKNRNKRTSNKFCGFNSITVSKFQLFSGMCYILPHCRSALSGICDKARNCLLHLNKSYLWEWFADGESVLQEQCWQVFVFYSCHIIYIYWWSKLYLLMVLHFKFILLQSLNVYLHLTWVFSWRNQVCLHFKASINKDFECFSQMFILRWGITRNYRITRLGYWQ